MGNAKEENGLFDTEAVGEPQLSPPGVPLLPPIVDRLLPKTVNPLVDPVTALRSGNSSIVPLGGLAQDQPVISPMSGGGAVDPFLLTPRDRTMTLMEQFGPGSEGGAVTQPVGPLGPGRFEANNPVQVEAMEQARIPPEFRDVFLPTPLGPGSTPVMPLPAPKPKLPPRRSTEFPRPPVRGLSRFMAPQFPFRGWGGW